VNGQIYRSNLERIQAQIETACLKSGRKPETVKLVTVTKSVEPTEIPVLLDLGLREFGENRWQVAKPKLELECAAQAAWHFIGTLQLNKVKYIVPRFQWIHSIDSTELGQAISQAAMKHDREINALVQVNVSGEQQKHGIYPEETFSVVEQLWRLPGIRLRGLMTMAPKTDDPESTRFVFRELARVLSDLQKKFDPDVMNQLSMGMSDDFPVAIEEGATIIRIGRSLLQ